MSLRTGASSQRLRAVAFVSVVLQAHIAFAVSPQAEAPPHESVTTPASEARASYREGETQYKLGRFEDALTAFSRAYEINPIPGFLFNIGQCHFNLKNYERAIFFYEGYLRDFPTAPNRAATQTQILIAKRELAKQQRLARKAAALTPEPASAPILIKPAVAEPASEPFAASVPSLPPVGVVEEHTPVYKTWWLWTIVGVVVVGGAAAVTVIALQPKTKTVLPSGSLPTIDLRGQ